MNKQEFLNALSDRLQGIPIDDREKSLEYYSEMIDDMQEDGLTEEQAVKAMGSINEIADKIINDMPIEKILKTKVTPKRKLSALEITLIAVGFPIWFPIAISLIAVIFTLYLVLWVLILCIYIVAFSFAVFIGALKASFGCIHATAYCFKKIKSSLAKRKGGAK